MALILSDGHPRRLAGTGLKDVPQVKAALRQSIIALILEDDTTESGCVAELLHKSGSVAAAGPGVPLDGAAAPSGATVAAAPVGPTIEPDPTSDSN